jgi:hypothetical protein
MDKIGLKEGLAMNIIRKFLCVSLALALAACQTTEVVSQGQRATEVTATSASPYDAWRQSPVRRDAISREHGYRVGFVDFEVLVVEDSTLVGSIMGNALLRNPREPSRVFTQDILDAFMAGRLRAADCTGVSYQFSETHGMNPGVYATRWADGSSGSTTVAWAAGDYPMATVPLRGGTAVLVVPIGPIDNSLGNPQLGVAPVNAAGQLVPLRYAPNGAPRVYTTPERLEDGISNTLRQTTQRGSHLIVLVVAPGAC